MPHYYFDLYNATGADIDEEGRDLPDVAAARAAALDDVRSLLSGEVRVGKLDLRGYVKVRSHGEGEVIRIAFNEAIELRQAE
jgi:hypothetical protein